MDLHEQIMNLQTPDYSGLLALPDYAAKIGHRDARHAAAELALKADVCIKVLREIIDAGLANGLIAKRGSEALAALDG